MSNTRSALRESRRADRVDHASPYARPAKKSSWGISSFWKWISSASEDSEDDQQPSSTNIRQSSDATQSGHTSKPSGNYMAHPAAVNLSMRGKAMQECLKSPSHSVNGSDNGSTAASSRLKPLMPRSNIPVSESAPVVESKDLDSTRDWLLAKVNRGEDIKASEAAGLLGMLSQVQSSPRQPMSFRDKLEKPRFTLSSHRSSPTNLALRGSSPRLLKSNPNGPISYRGLSASPSRNRSPFIPPATSIRGVENNALYTSPEGKKRRTNASPSTSLWSSPAASQPPAVPSPSKIDVSQSPERRRPYAATVEDDPDNDNAPPTTSLSNFMSESTSSTSSSIPFTPQTSSRVHGFSVHTPSPLKQSTQSDNLSKSINSDSQSPSTPSKPSTPMAYEIMSSIIKDAAASKPPSPPKLKHANVSNPYQSASIVAPRKIRKIPAPKLPETKPQESQKREEPKKQIKTTGNSFLDYLNTSAPNTNRTNASGSASSTTSKEPVMEQRSSAEEKIKDKHAIEIDELDDDEPIIIDKPVSLLSEVIEPIKNEVHSNDNKDTSRSRFAPTPTNPPAKSHKSLTKTPFFPKEPSPLRQSFAPSPNTSQSDISIDSSPAPIQTPTPAPFAPTALSNDALPEKTTKKRSKLSKEEVLAIPVDQLPKFNFEIQWPEVKRDPSKVAAAMAIPVDQLPKFVFPDEECHVHVKATITETSTPNPPAPTFNWAAAGGIPPTAVAGNWVCSTCGLSNPATATAKCTICDAPAPASQPTAKQGFDWNAAGLKKPSVSGWTCSTCSLSNAADAVKCTVCDAPAPEKPTAQSIQSSGGFNWAAAGMKLPTQSTSSWTCSVCGLSNPAEIKTKCSICDTPFSSNA